MLCGQEQRTGLTAGAVPIWRRSTATMGLLLPPLPKSLPPLLRSTPSPQQQQTRQITALSTHEKAEEQKAGWATAAPLTTAVQHMPTAALGHALTAHWLHSPAAHSPNQKLLQMLAGLLQCLSRQGRVLRPSILWVDLLPCCHCASCSTRGRALPSFMFPFSLSIYRP